MIKNLRGDSGFDPDQFSHYINLALHRFTLLNHYTIKSAHEPNRNRAYTLLNGYFKQLYNKVLHTTYRRSG
jgi:hypothetical protein